MREALSTPDKRAEELGFMLGALDLESIEKDRPDDSTGHVSPQRPMDTIYEEVGAAYPAVSDITSILKILNCNADCLDPSDEMIANICHMLKYDEFWIKVNSISSIDEKITYLQGAGYEFVQTYDPRKLQQGYFYLSHYENRFLIYFYEEERRLYLAELTEENIVAVRFKTDIYWRAYIESPNFHEQYQIKVLGYFPTPNTMEDVEMEHDDS